MVELIVALLLAGGAVWYVLQPILRPVFPGEPAGDTGDEGDDPDDDLSPRAVALRALKEIEFDRATGKLADADYHQLHAQYTAEALAALRVGESPDSRPRAAPRSGPSSSRPVCPVHGARAEPGAEFCADCGRRLGTGAGFCARCGAELEADAAYCGRCGVRVAA